MTHFAPFISFRGDPALCVCVGWVDILRTYAAIAKNPLNSSTLVCPPEEGDDERRREVEPFSAPSLPA